MITHPFSFLLSSSTCCEMLEDNQRGRDSLSLPLSLSLSLLPLIQTTAEGGGRKIIASDFGAGREKESEHTKTDGTTFANVKKYHVE